jgi:dTDP-4-dehydrorhamnose reductase
MTPLEVWGGVECTVNRVGDRWFDQLSRSGHDGRLDDLDRFARLGIRAIRYPILWERLAPRSLDAIDWRWSDERMSRLRELGIRPIVGLLHHGSGPRDTSLLDPEFPALLARYARLVAARYPWVSDFTPVNEPLTTARFSALYGHWYPHRRDDRAFVAALLTQLRGVVLAMRAIREVTPGARLVQTEDCGSSYGTDATAPQVQFEQHRRWLTWDLLSGRLTGKHPLHDWLIGAGARAEDLEAFAREPLPPDVLGLN